MQFIKSLAVVSGLLVSLSAAASSPGLPSTDSFYKVPSGVNLTAKANGAILSSRVVDPTASNAAKGYQLLYKTTDALGKADATVVTILIPKSPKSPAQIVGLQLPEDSVSIDCAPSAALVKGTSSPAALSLNTTNQGLEGSLQNGYYVVIPDHEGSKAAAFVGPTEGHATLDGLLAATSFPTAIPGVSISTPIAIGGYSGGAHATAWAAQLYPKYAPSLNIKGQIIGGTPVNLTNVLVYLNKGTYVGFAAVGIVGEYLAYSDINKYISENLYPNGTALFKQLQNNQCLLQVAFGYSRKDLFSYFKKANPLADPIPRKRLAQNLLGGDGSKLSIGTIMFHGEDDDVIPFSDATAYAKKQCAKGAKVHFYADPGKKHIAEEGSRGASLVGWFDDILKGKADFSCNL
ncbi:unnamed protein product [Tilletia controversa]|uniref:triacylglycerol lipase n=3 Tax=Tilletia TaxID=13289 RepID=A0A8X7MZH2_9BASI|nr:hypothetical protein CF336_g1312 [Tilletia laevis]KAE8204858.1 hypothetical protein CF328_g842 [Tilletia controversa]KAE8261259.1 hypothetical protein A4X03_0g3410 [Tilletia caries]KAE8208511.1 hypothetical protein CF335_g355 [Tilletia laevis]KAE8254521.1 hypothetical protein A4X06_0g854 [Tilletia controversa]